MADPPSRGITDVPLLANATDSSSLAKEKTTCNHRTDFWSWGRRLSDDPQMKTRVNAALDIQYLLESGSTNKLQ